MTSGRALRVHTDRRNHGDAWVRSFGDYTGGELWLEGDSKGKPLPTRDSAACLTSGAEPKNLRGKMSNTRVWTRIPKGAWQGVTRVKSGERTSIVLFAPANWDRVPEELLSDLVALGLPVAATPDDLIGTSLEG